MKLTYLGCAEITCSLNRKVAYVRPMRPSIIRRTGRVGYWRYRIRITRGSCEHDFTACRREVQQGISEPFGLGISGVIRELRARLDGHVESQRGRCQTYLHNQI
jgi:hypothetical protein